MSFWDTSDGGQVKAESEYESPSGGGVIPDDTDVLAYPDEVKWDEKDGNKYLSMRWRVAKPETLKNRVVFQKLWVMGNNPSQKEPEKRKKQGDNAKRMLAAIDTNAGGELMKINGVPTDEQLQSALLQKMMVVKLKVWEMRGDNGDMMQGNWIAAVSPKSKAISEGVVAMPAAKTQASSQGGSAAVDDDEIPF